MRLWRTREQVRPVERRRLDKAAKGDRHRDERAERKVKTADEDRPAESGGNETERDRYRKNALASNREQPERQGPLCSQVVERRQREERREASENGDVGA